MMLRAELPVHRKRTAYRRALTSIRASNPHGLGVERRRSDELPPGDCRCGGSRPLRSDEAGTSPGRSPRTCPSRAREGDGGVREGGRAGEPVGGRDVRARRRTEARALAASRSRGSSRSSPTSRRTRSRAARLRSARASAVKGASRTSRARRPRRRAPAHCAAAYAAVSRCAELAAHAAAIVTTGFKCAPESGPNVAISTAAGPRSRGCSRAARSRRSRREPLAHDPGPDDAGEEEARSQRPRRRRAG